MFIVLEGPDGVGKSTVARLLYDHYKNNGRRALLTREPGGTAMAEEIRETLLRHRDEKVSPYTELLLFNAARTQHNDVVIKPALESHTLVICDRYYASSYVYQCLKGDIDPKTFFELNRVCKHKTPDVTIYLDASPQTTIDRQSHLVLNRLDELFEDRQQARNMYQRAADHLSKHDGGRTLRISTQGLSANSVRDLIVTKLGLATRE